MGRGLATYHATQTYAPVEATVVSSSHNPRVEGGATGVDVEWTTDAEVRVEGGEVKDVTFLGKKNFENGQNVTLYKSDSGLSPTKPTPARAHYEVEGKEYSLELASKEVLTWLDTSLTSSRDRV